MDVFYNNHSITKFIKMKEQTYQSVVKASFYAQLLLESLDELEGTRIYRQSLKFKIKQAQQELEKQNSKYIDAMFKNDEEFLTNLQTHTDKLLNKISRLGLSEIPLVNKILDEYQKDSDHWKENLTIQFTKLNT